MLAQKNAYLKTLYNRYNKKFFEGKLPDIILGYATGAELKKSLKEKRSKEVLCAVTYFDEEHTTIPLSIVLNKEAHKYVADKKATVLHEMAHVSKPRAGHGKVFQEEMKRLAQAGAFSDIW